MMPYATYDTYTTKNPVWNTLSRTNKLCLSITISQLSIRRGLKTAIHNANIISSRNVLRIFQIIFCVCYTGALIIVYLCVFYFALVCLSILHYTFINAHCIFCLSSPHNRYFYIPTPRNVGVLK